MIVIILLLKSGVDNEAVELGDVNVSEKPPIENGNGVKGNDERDPNIHIETEKEQSKVNFDDIP
jgi:hypothetical protein